MRLPRTVSLILAGGVLVGIPAVTAAQDPQQDPAQTNMQAREAAAARLQLTTPLPTGCFSNPVSGPGGVTAKSVILPTIGLAGGKPGRRFIVAARPAVENSGLRGGSPGSRSGTFDANGNATITRFPLAAFLQTGPGRTYRLSVGVDGGSSDPNDLEPSFNKDLGTVTFAAYSAHLQETDGKFIRFYKQGRTYRVIASGAPLAGKKLYGFLVKSGSKVLKRIPMGTADACGYAKGKAVTWPRGEDPFNLKVYVNAGPKLDKARAVVTPARAGSTMTGPGGVCRGTSC